MSERVRMVAVPTGSHPREVALTVARREGAQLVEGWDAAVTALTAEALTTVAGLPETEPAPHLVADAALELRSRAHDAHHASVLATTLALGIVGLRRSLASLPAVSADPETIRNHAEEVSRARRRAEGAASMVGELDVDQEALAQAEEADRALARMDRRHALVGQAARGLAIAAIGLALMALGSRSASAAAAAGIIALALIGGGWWWVSSRRRVAAMERRTRQAMAEVGATTWEELDALLTRREEWEARFEEALAARRQVRTALTTWEQVAGDLDPDEVEAVAALAHERAGAKDALALLEEAAAVAAARHRHAESEWHAALAEVGIEPTPPLDVDRVMASLRLGGTVITGIDAVGPRADALREMLRSWTGRPVWVVARGTGSWDREAADAAGETADGA